MFLKFIFCLTNGMVFFPEIHIKSLHGTVFVVSWRSSSRCGTGSGWNGLGVDRCSCLCGRDHYLADCSHHRLRPVIDCRRLSTLYCGSCVLLLVTTSIFVTSSFFLLPSIPLPSNRQHLSNGDRLEGKRGDYLTSSVLLCIIIVHTYIMSSSNVVDWIGLWSCLA